MLAMQYTVRLPSEYDAQMVNDRVSMRGPMFDGCPGLAHKFYLYDREEHVYAPFYIWENSQAAQNFLMNTLFEDVVEDFGRPRVRSWQILNFGYGRSTIAPKKMLSEVDKVCEKQNLTTLKTHEQANHLKMLKNDDLFAHMVLLDPDRWEISRVSLWSRKDEAYKTRADCVSEYEVLEENRSMSGAA
ncbi:DUF4865 family protein [Sneathiella aquimaris]|uniref:DUF4865 family protein n=1 Tax=Sneathiella aquimaris TaxID=2599305 RepID=UPI00146E6171|nr:DUF4865 family protein [Sneathiella aquimaris]